MDDPESVEFRPLREADFQLLHRWLSTPHVVAGWGHGRVPTREEVAERYRPLVTGEKATRGYVIWADGRPAGFVQTYRILDHPDYAKAVGVEDDSYGIDLFLGEADLVGRGLGPRVIRAFADRVFRETMAAAVVADPASSNRRSVRAFEKAGFARWRSVVPADEDGGDLLMRLDRS